MKNGFWMIRGVICGTLVVAAFLLMPAMKSAEDKPKEVRVLCYNIHYGQGMDGEYDVERLAEVIKKEQPDICKNYIIAEYFLN